MSDQNVIISPPLCQAHPDRVAVAPVGSPFLCESCEEACVNCNEMGRPDECVRDHDGEDDHCSFESEVIYDRDDDEPMDTPSLADHPMYYHMHNRNPYTGESGY